MSVTGVCQSVLQSVGRWIDAVGLQLNNILLKSNISILTMDLGESPPRITGFRGQSNDDAGMLDVDFAFGSGAPVIILK